ncbi:MAG TPA: hypothetical protein PKM88_13695 [bacterium]|mgnify:CR=1 FL=1|nr:hypothetical protein [bacterium]
MLIVMLFGVALVLLVLMFMAFGMMAWRAHLKTAVPRPDAESVPKTAGCFRIAVFTLLAVPLLLLAVCLYLRPKQVAHTQLSPVTLAELQQRGAFVHHMTVTETQPQVRVTVAHEIPVSVEVGLPQMPRPLSLPWQQLAQPLLVQDSASFGIIAGGTCAGRLTAAKYTLQGERLWFYDAGSNHAHGNGILAARRRILILGDFDPALSNGTIGAILHIVDWDSGECLARVSAPYGADATFALDAEEEWLYIINSGTDAYQLRLDDCYSR